MENDIEFRTDDELLSAWLDGELPPDRKTELEQRLATDPALALRLERLSEANAALREAFAPAADEPMPQGVLDLIGADTRKAADGGFEAAPNAKLVDLGTRRRAREPGTFSWPAALAASVTLAIGAVLGFLIAPQGSSPESGLLASTGNIDPGSSLHDALETLPSGATREIAAGLALTPVLSFESRDGGYCRELAIAGADGSAAALACRRGRGWRVEALGFDEGPTLDVGAQGGGFRPASRASSAIDAAVDERIASEPLDAAAESALIESGWIPR